jgi:hypothetical protein
LNEGSDPQAGGISYSQVQFAVVALAQAGNGEDCHRQSDRGEFRLSSDEWASISDVEEGKHTLKRYTKTGQFCWGRSREFLPRLF